MPALWLLVVLLVLAAIALFTWLSVRLSLAIPITMAEQRIAIFDSFGFTKGRFWPLLGMALLAWVLSMVVGLLGSLVAMPLQMATGGGMMALEGLEEESLQVILQSAWPAIAAWIGINAVMSALQVAVVYAPFSAAYRDMKGAASE
jgi:membrane-anchored glycerophosphoryl diester phosphodiesterase (GDPDase)